MSSNRKPSAGLNRNEDVSLLVRRPGPLVDAVQDGFEVFDLDGHGYLKRILPPPK